jgi:hypothetical protein
MPELDPELESRVNRIGKPLAVLLTLAIVAVVFWQVRPGGEGGDQSVSPNPDGRGADMEEVGTNTWRAYAGPAFVLVSGNPADNFEFRMRLFGTLDDDTRSLVRSYRGLLQDPEAAKAIDLTDEQMAKLRAIELPRMIVSDDDRKHFADVWHAWQKADPPAKAEAREAVLTNLRDIARRSADPTKKAWTDAAATVKKTLTIQQLAKLAVYQDQHGTPGFGGPWNSPATTQNR